MRRLWAKYLAKLNNSLSAKLMRVVLASYFVVAFVVTAAHLMVEFVEARDSIVEDLVLLNRTFNRTLANSAWNMDRKQLESTLEGILSVPVIVGVKFKPANEMEESLAIGVVDDDSEATASDGNFEGLHKELFFRRFPVVYVTDDGSNFGAIGSLTLYSNRALVFARIQHSFIVILINSLLKTLALYFFIWQAIRRFLSRPLREFTGKLERLNLSPDLEDHKVDIREDESHEIREMAEAFNKMIERINRAVRRNLQLQDELSHMNADLEKRVESRTRQLHDAQQKLLKAAHASGVNQITSEILHNVGNVVNSVVISIQGIRRSISQEELEKFMNVIGVLQQQVESGNLDDISEIVEYFSLYGAKSKRDLEEMKVVLESLQKFILHLRHVTEIHKAALQDASYEAEIALEVLLDDCLYLAGLKQHPAIDVVIKSEPGIPVFLADEHRLIQVFVNLLLNAKQGIMEHEMLDRGRIEINFAKTSDFLRVVIADNGIGINAENVSKIFQSGFTTKPSGTGLGLHNSANNIKLMGGEISCVSDGKGHGCAFSFSIPLRIAKKAG